jgi:hypothetical protein
MYTKSGNKNKPPALLSQLVVAFTGRYTFISNFANLARLDQSKYVTRGPIPFKGTVHLNHKT